MSIGGAICCECYKKSAIPTRYLRRTNSDRPQLSAINEIINYASEMKESQIRAHRLHYLNVRGEEDPWGAKFLLEEYMSFLGIGRII